MIIFVVSDVVFFHQAASPDALNPTNLVRDGSSPTDGGKSRKQQQYIFKRFYPLVAGSLRKHIGCITQCSKRL